MPDNHTEGVVTCVCWRRPTIDYHRGVMLLQPSCANPACAVHAHSFPLFANESGAVAAWNIHIRMENRRLRRRRHGGALI